MRRWILVAIILICASILAVLLRPRATPSRVTQVEVLPVPQTSQKDLQKRLQVEEQRLESLQQDRNRVEQAISSPPSDGSIARQIDDLTTQQNDLQSQLRSLQNDARGVEQNAQDFQSADARVVELENQMQTLSAQTAVADQEAATAPLKDEIKSLEATKDQLRAQIRAGQLSAENTSVATAQEVQAEQEEVRDEYADVQRQLNDVRTQLDYWRKQASHSGDTEPAQALRRDELQRAITLQQAHVNRLENRLRELASRGGS